MTKESLEIIFNNIIQPILDSEADAVDKIEVLNNIKCFLDPDYYKENVKILMLNQNNKYKWRKKDENNNK